MKLLKHIQKLTFLLLVSTIISCGDYSEVVVPDDILPKEKMAEVMVDIHMLEAAMNINAGVSTETVPQELDVFRSHGVTVEQYRESFRFYTEHPEIMGEVYQIVLNELSKKQAEVSNGK